MLNFFSITTYKPSNIKKNKAIVYTKPNIKFKTTIYSRNWELSLTTGAALKVTISLRLKVNITIVGLLEE